MKKILYMVVLFVATACFQSCEKDPDLPVFTEEDYPRIMGRWPDKDNGALGEFDGEAGREFTIQMQFTPSDLCEGTWYLDGVEYSKGTLFEYYSYTPVVHHILLVVETPQYTTSREAILRIK